MIRVSSRTMPHRSQPILRRPPAACPWRATLLIAAAVIACGGHAWQPANGSEPVRHAHAARESLVAKIEQQFTPATHEAVAAAREEALASLNALEETLATQAVGGVLAAELQLGRLGELLFQVSPKTSSADATALAPWCGTLRQVLPGQAQQDLDRLRQTVASLVALGRRTPATLAAARDALATIDRHLGEPALALDSDSEQELRTAFDTVASVVTDESLVVELREHLSQPNAVILLRPAFVEHLARQSFTTPVAIDRCDAGTAITGRGSVAIDLSATLQESEGTCRLLVEAVGHGLISTLAVQQRARVRAAAHPQVAGTMPLVIDPRTIHGGDPAVTATLTTRLQQLSLGGLLGRSRLVQRVASRGEPMEIKHDDLPEFIAFALGVSDWQEAGSIDEVVRRSTARPRFPCLIVACNKGARGRPPGGSLRRRPPQADRPGDDAGLLEAGGARLLPAASRPLPRGAPEPRAPRHARDRPRDDVLRGSVDV